MDLLLFFLGRRRLFEVQGPSMLPALQPGQRLLVKPYRLNQPLPQNGSIVVCRHPNKPGLVITKRLSGRTDQQLDLRGDNPEESTDSRQYGSVAVDYLLGEATAIAETDMELGPTILIGAVLITCLIGLGSFVVLQSLLPKM